MEMHDAIDAIRPHIFSISTPNGSGTGWLVSLSKTTTLCAIATAAHVVDYAHYWELPIRVVHFNSGANLLLRAQDRAIHIDPVLDTAAIVFDRSQLNLPSEALPLIDSGYYIKQGVEIGWLGLPAIPNAGLCFFSGCISNYLEDQQRYFVDGVAINGVSGGPAFRTLQKQPELIGVVSAYIANRATGETLPGLAIVQNITQFHDIAQRFQNLDEAKAQETPPVEAPPRRESPGETDTRCQ
jgi:hypothetical protein